VTRGGLSIRFQTWCIIVRAISVNTIFRSLNLSDADDGTTTEAPGGEEKGDNASYHLLGDCIVQQLQIGSSLCSFDNGPTATIPATAENIVFVFD
jgi:hypothetical protein